MIQGKYNARNRLLQLNTKSTTKKLVNKAFLRLSPLGNKSVNAFPISLVQELFTIRQQFLRLKTQWPKNLLTQIQSGGKRTPNDISDYLK
jgi:hypothetical protein